MAGGPKFMYAALLTWRNVATETSTPSPGPVPAPQPSLQLPAKHSEDNC